MQHFSTKTLLRIAAGVELTKKKLRGASPGSYQLGRKKVMATNAVDTVTNGWLFRKFELRDIDRERSSGWTLGNFWQTLAGASDPFARVCRDCSGRSCRDSQGS
jgi:hypothetical protein